MQRLSTRLESIFLVCDKDAEDALQFSFKNSLEARIGLNWFHSLFPRFSGESGWNILTREVYRLLEHKRASVLPLVESEEIRTLSANDPQANNSEEITFHKLRHWLPVQEAYFFDVVRPV